MKFNQMSDKLFLETWDGKERPILFKRSHDFMQTKTGSIFVDYTDNDNGEPFKGTLICDLDDEANPEHPNETMNFINDLVVDSKKLVDLDLFLVSEDTDCILVSERVFLHLKNKGYTDIFFEEVRQI